MLAKVVILAKLPLLSETQTELQNLCSKNLTFPENNLNEEQLIAQSEGAKIVLVSPGTLLNNRYFDSCPSVKHIVVCGTSTANIDLSAAKARNVQIHNVAHYGDDITAETFINRLRDLVASGKTRFNHLSDISMGIIGLGAVGNALAAHAQAIKIQVTYYGPHKKRTDSIEYQPLPELLSSSNVVALCGPGNVMILGQNEFSLLKPGTILIQVSQGDITDINTFKQWALNDGNFALLDAAAGEKTKHELSSLPNVSISPEHSGYNEKSLLILGHKITNIINELLSKS